MTRSPEVMALAILRDLLSSPNSSRPLPGPIREVRALTSSRIACRLLTWAQS